MNLDTRSYWSVVRLLAFFLMIIDHVGCIFFGEYQFLRIIGRGAWFLFAILLVEGLGHSKSVPRYFLRLLILGILAIAPIWILARHGHFYSDINFNICFTLCLGLIACASLKAASRPGPYPALALVCIPSLMIVAELLRFDYGWFGVASCVVLYALKGMWIWQSIAFCAVGSIYVFAQCYDPIVLLTHQQGLLSLLSVVPIAIFCKWLYASRRWPSWSINKYIGYLFYPLHFVVLAVIYEFIRRCST